MKKEQDENPISDLENDPKYLSDLLKKHEVQYAAASARSVRLRDLMKRKSAQSWSLDKTQKMEKRLREALSEQEYSIGIVENIRAQLERLGA